MLEGASCTEQLFAVAALLGWSFAWVIGGLMLVILRWWRSG